MNNYCDYTDPFIDYSELKDAVFIDGKNNVKTIKEETKEEAAKLFQEILDELKRPKLAKNTINFKLKYIQ